MTQAMHTPLVEPPSHRDFPARTRVLFGLDLLRTLGTELARLAQDHPQSSSSVLLVSDPGVARAGHVAAARQTLHDAGFSVTIFDRVIENPSSDTVHDCAELGLRCNAKWLVAVGGGSSIDTAKGANFVMAHGQPIHNFVGQNKATRPMLPLVAVPTTAGTGSEVQRFALISHAQTHAKMACGDPAAAPRLALLDPALSLSQPHHVTATAGIDALVHAIEAAVTRTRWPISDAFATQAFTLLAGALPILCDHPADLTARGNALLGATLAGLAIEHSMLGAAHAAANPLTAHLGTTHGVAVALTLPYVIRFNAQDPGTHRIYGALLHSLETMPRHSSSTDNSAADRLADMFCSIRQKLNLPASVSLPQAPNTPYHAPLLRQLAAEAAGQWTARHNPVPISENDFAQLYQQVLSG